MREAGHNPGHANKIMGDISMAECKCRFYEVDLEAKAEAESWAAGIPEADIRAMEAMMYETGEEDPNPVSKCGEFCKYLRSGNGFPGEYVDCCNAPGNEHIIHVDFNIADII